MSRFATRILTGTALAALVAGLLWLANRFPPGCVALAVVTGLACVSVWELDRMGSFRPLRIAFGLYPSVLAAGVLVAADLFSGWHLAGWTLLLLLYALAGVAAFPARGTRHLLRFVQRAPSTDESPPKSLPGVALSLWLVPPLFALVLVDRDFGAGGLVALIVLAKIGDNAGFFVGRAIGKTHPFPKISPGKTVAGCVASLVAGIVGGAIVLPLTLGERSWSHALLGAAVGAAINLAAQAGDLSESWVKRRAGVKDSSALVGASGGVLDVIDSLLLASPVALLLWTWLYPGSDPMSS